METTQTTNDTLLEGVKISEKWFNNANAAMMEIYNKQLNLATGYYTNLINSTLGGNHGQDKMTNPFSALFNADAAKGFWFPFGSNGSVFSNHFLSSFNKVSEDLAEYNRNLLATLNTEFKSNVSDWSKIKQEYREYFEKQLEISKKIGSSIAEAIDKQGNFSTQIYKDAVEKINHQMDSGVQQDQDVLSTILNSTQNSSNTEEKKTKDSVVSDTKKKTNATVPA
jgi:hypothetical protein